MAKEWTVTLMSKADATAMMALQVFESGMGRVRAVRQLGPRMVLVRRCGRVRWHWHRLKAKLRNIAFDLKTRRHERRKAVQS